MPEFRSEPYLYLPTVTHKSALVAWGAFHFRVTGGAIDVRLRERGRAIAGVGREKLERAALRHAIDAMSAATPMRRGGQSTGTGTGSGASLETLPVATSICAVVM